MMLKYKDKKWYQLWWQREERRTLYTWKSWRSLFFFSQFFLSTRGSAKHTHAFILSTISYTLLLPQSLEDCGAAADTGRPSISRTERNGTGGAHRGRKSLSFRFARWSARRSWAKGPFHVHKSCTHIYLTYISLSTHPAVMFGKKRKDNSAKTRCCGGLPAAVLLSFLCPLRCLPNAVDLNEEKSLINPQPPHLPRPSKIPNQVAEDAKFTYWGSNQWGSGVRLCLLSELFFFLSLSSCPAIGLFCHFFVCLFVQKGPFFPSTYNEGEQTNR